MKSIIIIGAARSGTKLVRDLLALHCRVAKVPYDINYVWRLGSESVPHDELPIENLTPQVRKRILNHFDRYSSSMPFLVEKTVSNCLRVPYVNSVFPNSRFIHLVRDGRDVVESAYRQWTRPPDWRYILKKARVFPLFKAPSYALSYLINVFRKTLNQENNHSTWGPRYKGIDQDVASRDLLEVCAIQWASCIKKAVSDLNGLPDNRVLNIHYEDFVLCPREHLAEMANFIGLYPDSYANISLNVVSQSNIGKGWRNLNIEQRDMIVSYIEEVLLMLGYE